MQASDISNTCCPFGPRRTMSASSLADIPRSVTLTSVTVPPTPDTGMLDGYAMAGPKMPPSAGGAERLSGWRM